MALVVYMTAPSAEEAQRIACDLVENRLAAGVNILSSVHSVYRWKGAVCKASEVTLIAKTTEARFDALATRVRQLHSYETPCIIALPILCGDKDFLDWIADSVEDFDTRAC